MTDPVGPNSANFVPNGAERAESGRDAASFAELGQVRWVDSSPSTNAELLERLDWPHFSALVTRDQTAGRGRLDRSWVTPPGSALAISVLLTELPEQRGWIPLIAGAAMAESVAAQLPEHSVGVKWPNDVLVEGRKICGILAEAKSDAIVLGAGINTAMTSDQLPVSTAVSFGVLGQECDEEKLVADYLAALGRYLAVLQRGESVRQSVADRCVSIGRSVEVSLPNGEKMNGIATALNADGHLLVDVAGEQRTVTAGDIVHAKLV